MLTVCEMLLYRQPDVLRALVVRGLLPPDFSLERQTVVEYTGRLRTIERLMAHDAYLRANGALRQVRWAG